MGARDRVKILQRGNRKSCLGVGSDQGPLDEKSESIAVKSGI